MTSREQQGKFETRLIITSAVRRRYCIVLGERAALPSISAFTPYLSSLPLEIQRSKTSQNGSLLPRKR